MSPRTSPDADALDTFLEIAAREVERVCSSADRASIRAASRLIQEVESAGGRVHVTGIGKPEHVARYAAALLSSTGTPASFLHGTEATHGGVGQMRSGDVVIAISNSGETAELLETIAALGRIPVRLVAVTSRGDSPLGQAAETVLIAGVEHEGGPLNLAPRASVLAEIVVLAALSVELQATKKFTRQDYNLRHPAGSLGKRSARSDD